MHSPRAAHFVPLLPGEVNAPKCFQVAQVFHSWEMLLCQKGIWIKPNPFWSTPPELPHEPHSPKLCTISYCPPKLSPASQVQSPSHNIYIFIIQPTGGKNGEGSSSTRLLHVFIFVPILDSLLNEEYSLKHLCTALLEIKKSKLVPGCFCPSLPLAISHSHRAKSTFKNFHHLLCLY